MTNDQFIAQVKDLISYYVTTQRAQVENNMTYSSYNVIKAHYEVIDQKVAPITAKLMEVEKVLNG